MNETTAPEFPQFEGLQVPPARDETGQLIKNMQIDRCTRTVCAGMGCAKCLFNPEQLSAYRRWVAAGFHNISPPDTAPCDGSTFIALVTDGDQNFFTSGAWSATHERFVYAVGVVLDSCLDQVTDTEFQTTTELELKGWKSWEVTA